MGQYRIALCQRRMRQLKHILHQMRLTWHNCDLKGGKPEIGSRFLSSTSKFILASSGQWCGVETTPANIVSVTLAFILTLPLGELMTTASPFRIFRDMASIGFMSTNGSGINRRSRSMLRNCECV